MIVPEYWAEAKLKKRFKGRQITVRRFGWSDETLEAAQQHADQRAAEAMALIESGNRKLERRELKLAYNGADGVPIREEIIERHDDTIITRNSYGALCLNTPDVLFADVDFDRDPPVKPGCGLFVLMMLVIGWYSWSAGSWPRLFGFSLAAMVLGPIVYILGFKLLMRLQGGAKRSVLRSIHRFARNNPDWRIRLYQTPAGYRLLVMNRTFSANDPQVLAFFKAVHADPMYVTMCRKQNCFRARVSPKPWRVGFGRHLKPRPGVWPINPERMPDRVRWVEEYTALAEEFASCQFVDEFGGDAIDPKADQVRLIHDAHCKATSTLPLA